MKSRTTRTLLVMAALALALAGCSDSGSDSGGGTDAGNGTQPSPAPAQASTSRPPLTGTAGDCLGVIEKHYGANTLQDASSDPACKDLSSEQYTHIVGMVFLAHKDPLLQKNDSADAWDKAWGNMGADTQGDVCDMLKNEGADAAAPAISKEQGQHLLDSKC